MVVFMAELLHTAPGARRGRARRSGCRAGGADGPANALTHRSADDRVWRRARPAARPAGAVPLSRATPSCAG